MQFAPVLCFIGLFLVSSNLSNDTSFGGGLRRGLQHSPFRRSGDDMKTRDLFLRKLHRIISRENNKWVFSPLVRKISGSSCNLRIESRKISYLNPAFKGINAITDIYSRKYRNIESLQDSKMATVVKSTTEEVSTLTESVQSLKFKPEKRHVETFRKDYRPPEFDIDNVYLKIDLHDTETKVSAELLMRRRPNTPPGNLVLHGCELICKSVFVDDIELENAVLRGYSIDVDGNITIPAFLLPVDDKKTFKVRTEVIINPRDNFKLTGLYKSGDIFCTQCEPHGFRHITYFLDRPDVLSVYRVYLEADKSLFPVLLSNGNKVVSGDLGARHFAEFFDPYPKPSYLFALVAGNLSSIGSTFKTMSGREVKVQLHSRPDDVSKLHWALESVLKAMSWDEVKYGREYDLNEFHVVCARDFNMGAMENKGLNIFNTALLLADVKTTTDFEFMTIMAVVGHEYFHNWTGNRVTCRDWFQLTLKEGLTVFRDAEFSEDMASTLLSRIEDIKTMLSVQFLEDAGPIAHPIRPESYISMDNFYTTTVYDKGAEVVRMYKTMLGEEGFRKGMDLYFQRHDLKAVTCEDFRAAMADANHKDLSQFGLWYSQSGTPEVQVVEAKREGDKFKITLKQFTPPTTGQPQKYPLHIPIKVGLIGRESKTDLTSGSVLLELTESEQTFTIDNIREDCVLSFNRNFSAPIKVKFDLSEDDLAFLLSYDSDSVNRWDSSFRITSRAIISSAQGIPKDNSTLMEAFGLVLSSSLPFDEKAVCIQLPDFNILTSQLDSSDPVKLHSAIRALKLDILDKFEGQFRDLYEKLTLEDGVEETLEKKDLARRYLRNTLLSYLVARRDKDAIDFALKHFYKAKIMNDKYPAFSHLMSMDFSDKEKVIQEFYDYAEGDQQVIDKWFRAQALSEASDSIERVKSLAKHPEFSMSNPNRFYSLVRAFSRGINYHHESGCGYEFLADMIIQVDKINPQVSARTATELTKFKKFDALRRGLMVEQLRRISKTFELSPNLYEIVRRSLDFV